MPFQLLNVSGCVDPILVGKQAKTQKQLENEVVKYIQESDYNSEEDLLFYLILDSKGRLKDVGTFSGGFMDELRERANACSPVSAARPR